jgi:hypothetical protein
MQALLRLLVVSCRRATAISFAVDANVLVYASNTASPEHVRARDFLSACARGTELLCLGWPTLMAYLRISTQPAIFPTPLSPERGRGQHSCTAPASSRSGGLRAGRVLGGLL